MKTQHLAIICGMLDALDPTGAQVIELANDLTHRGHRVSVLALTVNECELVPEVTLYQATTRRPRWLWLGMARYQRWVAKTLADLQPEHTLSVVSTVPAETMAPINGLLRSRIKAQASLRAGPAKRLAQHIQNLHPRVSVMRLLERRAMANLKVKRFVAVSRLIQNQIEELPLKEPPTIERARIANPARAVPVANATQLRQQLAKAWDLQQDSYWIVLPFAYGGLDGLEPMLRAMKPLVEGGVDAFLLLAGPSRYTHLAWIADLGLRDRVRFVGKTAMLDELMAGADLVVNPTSHDPLGLPVMHAIAAGRPVITTPASGFADQAPEQALVTLSSPVEPAALLSAIREQYEQWQEDAQPAAKAGSDAAEEPLLADCVDDLVQTPPTQTPPQTG